jgi:hypothetical protein
MSSEFVHPPTLHRIITDRRLNEPAALPPCGCCGSPDTSVAMRTDYVLYLRCANCWQVWSVPKPERDPGS